MVLTADEIDRLPGPFVLGRKGVGRYLTIDECGEQFLV